MLQQSPSGAVAPWRSPARRVRPFTLVEMMVVMVIVIILIGMSWYVAGSVVGGSSVDAGARTANSQLRLARSYAVSKREYVALLMPTSANLSAESMDLTRQFGEGGIRPCLVTITGSTITFKEYIQGGEWEFAPRSVALTGVIDTSPSTALPVCTSVPFPDVGGNNRSMACIVFKPSGQLYDVSKSVVVTSEPELNPGTDQRKLEVNWLTGKVTYLE